MRYPGGLPRAETSRDIHGLIRAYISLRHDHGMDC